MNTHTQITLHDHFRFHHLFLFFFSFFLLRAGDGGSIPSLLLLLGRESTYPYRTLSLQPHSHPHNSLPPFSKHTHIHTHTHTHIQKDTTSKSRHCRRITSTTHWLLNPGLFLCPPLQPASTWYSPSIPCQVAFTHGGEACLKQLLTSYKQDSLPFPPLSFAFFSSPLSRAPTTHVCFAPQPSLLLTPLALSVPPPFLSPPLSSSSFFSFPLFLSHLPTSLPPLSLRMWGPH